MESKVYGIVYMIVDLTNNKKYIGQTITPLKERFNKHIKASKCISHRQYKMLIAQAIRNHGQENFVYGEICVAYSKQELLKLEKEYIKQYDTLNPDKGYNFAKPGLKRNGARQSRSNTTSKYVGVSAYKNGWVACIRVDKEKIYLGYFKSEIEAAKARDAASIKYIGNEAILNFPII